MSATGAFVLFGASAALVAATWDVPPEGSCGGQRAPDALVEDAVPTPLPGDVITHDSVARLERLLPASVWSNRERFFFDGMRLEIGPCHRNYDPPGFFQDTTRRFRGAASIDAEGRLENHTAGLPFPPEGISKEDPQAALKWAWNWVQRYQAAGSYGDLRVTVMLRNGEAVPLTGDHFFVPLVGRADRADHDYRITDGPKAIWAAGGSLRNLSTGAECAFREYGKGSRRPDTFTWSGFQRRVTRVTAPDAERSLTGCWVDVPTGPTIATHGWEPSLHHWSLVGTRELLTPINASRPVYPGSLDRDFGPSGVSFANDRWELRQALILEGRLKEGQFEDRVERFRWYLDLQTLTPLYYAGYRSDDTPAGIAMFVHRWSEDREDYPAWPNDPARPVRVLDEVAVVMIDVDTISSVRMEAWERVGTPPPDAKLKRLVSQSGLRGK